MFLYFLPLKFRFLPRPEDDDAVSISAAIEQVHRTRDAIFFFLFSSLFNSNNFLPSIQWGNKWVKSILSSGERSIKSVCKKKRKKFGMNKKRNLNGRNIFSFLYRNIYNLTGIIHILLWPAISGELWMPSSSGIPQSKWYHERGEEKK